jgi:prepilin-type processing-associated H-X9-DG protein
MITGRRRAASTMPEDNVMYKIIGTDQKEYGPVAAEQLRQWILGGRANAQTLAQAEGGVGWKPLSEFPEFADVLATRVGAVPPKTGGPAPTSGMAIASLVLGLVGVCGITAVVGLIFGIVSLRKIQRSQGQLLGQGFAIAGIALSAVMLLCFIPMMAGMTLPAFAKAKQKAQTIVCLSNVRQLCLASITYADSHNGHLPEANTWCDLVETNVAGGSQVFRCPMGKSSERCHYAFNTKLGGVETKDIKSPAQTVMLFESAGGWNASGGAEQLLKSRRHSGAIVVGFADGHAEMVTPTRLDKLVWEP